MSPRYLGHVVSDELVTPPAEHIAELLGPLGFDWAALAAELGLGATEGPGGFVRAAADALARDGAFAAALDGALGGGQREALRAERLDLAEGVDFAELPLAWLADALLSPREARAPAPARRVAVELVTLDPAAGAPPSASAHDVRQFALRWLAEADRVAGGAQRIVAFLTARGGEGAFVSPAGAGVNDDVPGVVWASALAVLPLRVDDEAFFAAHASAWWARPHAWGGGDGLRARWRAAEEPERAALLRAEAFVHPCWLEAPRDGAFESAAFWSE
jgi:hypothetical protein